jgi:hypothetical protein
MERAVTFTAVTEINTLERKLETSVLLLSYLPSVTSGPTQQVLVASENIKQMSQTRSFRTQWLHDCREILITKLKEKTYQLERVPSSDSFTWSDSIAGLIS